MVIRLMDGGVLFPPLQAPDLSSRPEGTPDLSGKVFVFTGKMEGLSRDDGKKRVQALGGTVTGSISANTSYLVAGEKAGSKLVKAQALGVRVLSPGEFLAWVNPPE